MINRHVTVAEMNEFSRKDFDFIRNFAAKHGVENVLFEIPLRPIRSFGPVSFTQSDDEETQTLCSIYEERYKVEDGYKITLVHKDDNGNIDNYESYYQSDLASLLRNVPKRFKLFVKEKVHETKDP